MQKLIAFLDIPEKLNLKLKSQFHLKQPTEKGRILWYKSNKNNNIYVENYKNLEKEMKGYQNKWKEISCPLLDDSIFLRCQFFLI